FARHHGLGELTDYRELITEVSIERLEPIWQGDGCQAGAVRRDVTVVDVFHIRRFHEGVVEVLVFRIERVIDFERPTSFGEVAVDVDIANEKRGIASGMLVRGIKSVAS